MNINFNNPLKSITSTHDRYNTVIAATERRAADGTLSQETADRIIARQREHLSGPNERVFKSVFSVRWGGPHGYANSFEIRLNGLRLNIGSWARKYGEMVPEAGNTSIWHSKLFGTMDDLGL